MEGLAGAPLTIPGRVVLEGQESDTFKKQEVVSSF